jgi:hypothetical protein
MHYAGALIVLLLAGTGIPVAAQTAPWAPLPPRPAYADSLPDVSRFPIPLSVALAEAEGRAWPHRTEPCGLPTADCARSFASPVERTCVQTHGIGPARSGEFVIGGEIVSPFGARKIWWSPMHPATGFALVVRARLLASSADTVTFTSSDWGRGMPNGAFFVPSGFTWPKEGHWLAITTSGPDWGCFVM